MLLDIIDRVRKIFIICVVLGFIFLFGKSISPVFADYNECVIAASTGCLASGLHIGDVAHVTTDSGGHYVSCALIGHYACDAPWGSCGGLVNGKTFGICYSSGPGNPLPNGIPASQVLYPVPATSAMNPKQGGNACQDQAFSRGLSSDALLWCVCGVPGASACPTAASPTPTIPPTPSSTSLTLVLGLPGIGKITGVVGVLPKHLTRTATVELYDAAVTNPSGPGTAPLATKVATVTYDNGTDNNVGYFVSSPITIPLPANPPANNEYEILVKVPQYLYRLALPVVPVDQNNPHAFLIQSSSSVTTSPLNLFPGDIVSTNSMGNDDYTQIKTCFDSISDSTCQKTPDGILYTDLDDNGVVDIVDFNLWTRSLFQLQQAQPPVCTGLTCQGD